MTHNSIPRHLSKSNENKTLMLGGIGGRRRRGRQRMRWLDGITDSMGVSLSELRSWWWTGRPGVLQFMGSQRVGHDWATELKVKTKSDEIGEESIFSVLLRHWTNPLLQGCLPYQWHFQFFFQWCQVELGFLSLSTKSILRYISGYTGIFNTD